MKKSLLTYVVTLFIFVAGIAFILNYGSRLNKNEVVTTGVAETGATKSVAPSPPAKSETASAHAGKASHENARSTLSILLLQIIVILTVAKLFGRLFQRIGQPAVIGEMAAGILLGPSLLGLLSPSTMSFLFPESSMEPLKLLSQIGVIIFMFIVGMELNTQRLREKAHSAVMISHASIIVPLFLGVALSLVIYQPLAPDGVSFMAFALFIGIAMSITAFPVLARILEERRLSSSHIGSTTIACAAVDDVTAWCLLAIVVAISKAQGLNGLLTPILFSLLFVGAMIFLVKPQLAHILKREVEDETQSALPVAAILAFVFACAWLTEIIGIHALFGGFLAGVIMPSAAGLRSFLKLKLEAISSSLLVPLFFAFTGLRTQIDHLNDWQSWVMGAGIIAVAIAGKLGASTIAARWTGMSWGESFSIGALMNTRGLVELIVLNIGYDLGILSPRIFSIMVLMALITTCMTGPLLTLIASLENRKKAYLNHDNSVRHAEINANAG
jgi:Kef-type K+ transport system membrane component KefB